MGVAALAALELRAPIAKPTGLVIVETDGCFVDGVEVATGATVGHRTLRVVDMGKIAATFVHVDSGRALRFAPKGGIRTLAFAYAPKVEERYRAQLEGYQVMPTSDLFAFEEVDLLPSLESLLSRPDARAACSVCGEEIVNERELAREGTLLCQSCAGLGYYSKRTATPAQAPSARAARQT